MVVSILRRKSRLTDRGRWEAQLAVVLPKITAVLEKAPGFVSVQYAWDVNGGGEFAQITTWQTEDDCNRYVREGAAVMILETESHAKKRGANILAELAGYSASADAYHITAPHDKGTGGSQAIRNALDVAGVNLTDVSYINAHGTGTTLNDLSETRAIKSVFGEKAYDVPVSSTKSMTGHMMGATGALEALFCVLAIQDSILPPTINYVDPDPECDLDYVPNKARQANVDVALTNAFGFGGHNAVLVIRKYR